MQRFIALPAALSRGQSARCCWSRNGSGLLIDAASLASTASRARFASGSAARDASPALPSEASAPLARIALMNVGSGGKIVLPGRFDLPAALLPTRLPSGGWRRPRVSARMAAELRKQSILMRAQGGSGIDWDTLDAGWRGHKVAKAGHARPPNGRKHDSKIEARCVNVERASGGFTKGDEARVLLSSAVQTMLAARLPRCRRRLSRCRAAACGVNHPQHVAPSAQFVGCHAINATIAHLSLHTCHSAASTK